MRNGLRALPPSKAAKYCADGDVEVDDKGEGEGEDVVEVTEGLDGLYRKGAGVADWDHRPGKGHFTGRIGACLR